MDEENSLDFQALRAKFQEEELLLKQSLKPKPALPEKPKVVPPPQSPPYYMPAGARPSLLTSINQSLEGKTPLAPRVVFKDEKKESKKPLLPSNSKPKDSKIKVGKDKSKGGRERLYDEDTPPQKPKKEKKKETTAELVPATPPPKNSTLKKKGFLGFKKSKRDSVEIIDDPILDIPSSEVSGPVPLTPMTQDFSSSTPETRTPPKALMPELLTIPTSSPAVETPTLTVSTSPDFNSPDITSPDVTSTDITPPPAFFSEVPIVPVPLTLENENTAPTETLSVLHPPSENEVPISLTPPLIIPEPDVSVLASVHSTPPPENTESPVELLNLDSLKIPPPPVDLDTLSVSSKAECSPSALSALSALERAEEMSPGKRTPPGDQRIFNALEKVRRMAHNHPKPTTSLVTPPPEEHPEVHDEATLFELPPIDYEDKMAKGLPPKPEVNGLDHRSSLVLEGIEEEEIPEQPEMRPPPPPRKLLPENETLPVAPPKPARPPTMDLSAFIPPPPLEDSAVAIPAPVEFSETNTDIAAHTDVPEFEDRTPEAHSPDLPVSDWGSGDYNGSESPDGPHIPELIPNGTIPTAEVQATTPVFDVTDSPSNRDSLLLTPGVQGVSPYEPTENVYEDVSSSKKKGKTDGKKRKGPPKNPYAEAPEMTEEKTKTGRFGKSDKKAVAALEGLDEKELKKREKQRLEKEKKELKERQEREKKEQKEREKRENELKKKFKITGQEDAMYQATVTVTSKGRKQDLPVKSGDTISIIRTTNCPKGKWLARDSSNNYGYVAVNHVDLDIKEMLEMGKKAAVSRLNSTNVEQEVTSTGSRASNHYPNESFTDDSEEWTCDDDEPLSPTENVVPELPIVHNRTHSLPDMGETGSEELTINHQHSQSDLVEGSHVQARHEALAKLATFFHPPKTTEPTASPVEPATTPEVITEEETLREPSPSEDLDLNIPILPPPEQYADFFDE
ncbi:hypothetical protein NL108_007070 [Boleophthalmus pectinirostris]|uniref:FYN-binding protein 1 n=1 Tax=Boleophthalmus pectinirostris TaxID=150288 RepID=UPI00242F4FBD|nr:FYN-binding protein 1 [Boleophthalmus pectinirostris]KAJ0065338.1 hypothetical protein NL108_007070 [Boleophthalmus pectinirostris]